jgi:hypothetical protein
MMMMPTTASHSRWHQLGTTKVGENLKARLGRQARYVISRPIYYIPICLFPMTPLSPQSKIVPKQSEFLGPLIPLSIFGISKK